MEEFDQLVLCNHFYSKVTNSSLNQSIKLMSMRAGVITAKNAGVPLAGTGVELGWNCLELLKINVELTWNGWNACGYSSSEFRFQNEFVLVPQIVPGVPESSSILKH